MDIYCPICGEPYDHDELHDVPGKSYAEASREFIRVGCKVFDASHGVRDARRAEVASAAYAVLGDDLDGAAAMMEDYLY